jgi:hypothetical protein
MSHELSKREKKIARACLDKGLDAEFREGLEKFETILQDWRAGKFANNKEAYHALYGAVHKKDKAIGRRYDGLTGSRWLITIVGILQDGYISEEDIKDFSDETKETIERWRNILTQAISLLVSQFHTQ